jgi:hypothetical protein
MATGTNLRIDQPDALSNILQTPAAGSLLLDLPLLNPSESKHWQAELNKLLNPCGCGEAAAGLLISIAILLTVGVIFWHTCKGAPFQSSALGLTLSVVSIAAGKMYGKLRGRRRLAASIAQLQALLKHRSGGITMGGTNECQVMHQ